MNEMTAYVTAFVEQLAHMGVQQVVISPGSRSTPLAMVMAEHPTLNIHVHIDERSAAFSHWAWRRLLESQLLLFVHQGQQ